jgi:DsbC/DsbD-like thiol-disulfide interchange protein
MRAGHKAIPALALLMLAATAVALGQRAVGAVGSSPWVELSSARVRLVAGGAGAGSAGPWLAGVEIALAEGWKTYWRTPGDAGVPPAFDWTGSVNVSSIQVRYPVPSRLPEPGAETIGYKGHVLFPVEVVPVDAGRPVNLELTLSLGICRDICIPAEAKLDLALQPLQRGREVSPELAAALERVPRPQSGRRAGDPKLEKVAADLGGERPRLLVEASFAGGGRAGDVLVEAPDGIYLPQPKRLTGGAGEVLRFGVDLSRVDIKDLKGKVLTFTLIGERGATEATWAVP